MSGWRGLLRAALALVGAAMFWLGIYIVGVLVAAGPSTNVAFVPGGILPAILAAELAGLLPALGLLLILRRLTVVRLMLWTGLATGLAFMAWALSIGQPLWHWTALFQAAVAVLFGFLNAGLFALIAGVRKWPVARSA